MSAVRVAVDLDPDDYADGWDAYVNGAADDTHTTPPIPTPGWIAGYRAACEAHATLDTAPVVHLRPVR